MFLTEKATLRFYPSAARPPSLTRRAWMPIRPAPCDLFPRAALSICRSFARPHAGRQLSSVYL